MTFLLKPAVCMGSYQQANKPSKNNITLSIYHNLSLGSHMKQARVITETEMKRVLTLIDAGKHAERNRLAVLLSYHAGLRAKEICSINMTDVIGTDGKVKDEIRLSSDQTKGKRGRIIFLNSKLQKEITAYLKAQPANGSYLPLIRSQKSNKPFSANTMVQLLCHLYKQAGIDGASSHSGRRTFITTLAEKGIGARTLQHLAGHKSLNTTQRYIDVNDTMLRKAVELL